MLGPVLVGLDLVLRGHGPVLLALQQPRALTSAGPQQPVHPVILLLILQPHPLDVALLQPAVELGFRAGQTTTATAAALGAAAVAGALAIDLLDALHADALVVEVVVLREIAVLEDQPMAVLLGELLRVVENLVVALLRRDEEIGVARLGVLGDVVELDLAFQQQLLHVVVDEAGLCGRRWRRGRRRGRLDYLLGVEGLLVVVQRRAVRRVGRAV